MVYPKLCCPIAQISVFPLSQDDQLSAKVKALMVELDAGVKNKSGDQRLDDDCFANFSEMPPSYLQTFSMTTNPHRILSSTLKAQSG
jgi:hypothetical protein